MAQFAWDWLWTIVGERVDLPFGQLIHVVGRVVMGWFIAIAWVESTWTAYLWVSDNWLNHPQVAARRNERAGGSVDRTRIPRAHGRSNLLFGPGQRGAEALARAMRMLV